MIETVFGDDLYDESQFDWQKKVAAKFNRVDLDLVWSLCGGVSKRTEAFETELRRVLARYTPKQRVLPKVPAKQRDRIYDQIDKSARSLRRMLSDIPPALEAELHDTFIYHSPEDLYQQTAGEYEGLSYFDFHAFRIMDSVSVLLEHLPEARNDHKPQTGRPKQNENLEETIRGLGKIFQSTSGKSVADRFRFNDLDLAQPYQGPFMDFLCTTIWGFNGTDFPSSAALGEATRRAFTLRK